MADLDMSYPLQMVGHLHPVSQRRYAKAVRGRGFPGAGCEKGVAGFSRKFRSKSLEAITFVILRYVETP
jgi:hypothetical protein